MPDEIFSDRGCIAGACGLLGNLRVGRAFWRDQNGQEIDTGGKADGERGTVAEKKGNELFISRIPQKNAASDGSFQLYSLPTICKRGTGKTRSS